MERNVICVTELNEVMNCSKSEKDNLYVGLCGTQYVGSDRYPVVITEVISPKSVRVCWLEDVDFEHNLLKDKNDNDYIKVIGNYVHLNKDLTKIEPNGKVFKLRKNGRWIVEGDDLWATGSVHFGEADSYLDPSF